MGDPVQVRRWQAATLILLFVGYSGYYLCRSNLSVVTPLLIDEMAAKGADPKDALKTIGWIASTGTLAYAVGKFIFGATGDVIGGRRNFLGGMTGAVVFTLVFSAGGSFPLFTAAWIGNRFIQSSGWPGLVKIAGRWFDYRWHGTALGFLSLSFLFGDTAGRWFMGVLLEYKLGWRSLFVVTAAVLAGILVVCLAFLKESPKDIGAPEGSTSPVNVYGDDHESAGFVATLLPLLRSAGFWYVCLLSLSMTILRETFLQWLPQYFTSALHFETHQAAKLSAGFPFFGGCSVLITGYLGDRLGRGGRSIILFTGLLATGISLFVLRGMGEAADARAAVSLVLLSGFFLLGPYSYLAGAIALDFGGKRGSATACGIIDGVGYLGGYYAGRGVAGIVSDHGWSTAWGFLAAVSLAGSIVAAVYWRDQSHRIVPRPQPETAP